MTQPPGTTPIAGLLVPNALVPNVIAALRWQYPLATAGKTDNAAVRSALKEWVTQILSMHAAYLAAQDGDAQVAALRQTVNDTQQAAAEAIRNAATAGIVDSPTAP